MTEDLSLLSDEQLEARLFAAVQRERERTIEVIACLAELHRRHLATRRGYSGLFSYCTEKLGYSPAQAARRVGAARLSVRYPKVLEKLEARQMPVSAVRLISPVMTPENSDSLLEKASALPFGELEKMTAKMNPQSATQDTVRVTAVVPSTGPELPLFSGNEEPARPEPEIRIHFGFTGSEELRQKLDRAKQVLWHKFPSGHLEDVIGQALDDLLDKRDPDRRKEPRKPNVNAKADEAHRRYIPVWVRAEVWKRDGGCCAFTTQDGVRCAEKSALEYDHVVPWALGGPSDEPENIRLLCRAHNQLLARETFGEKAAGRAAA